MQRSARRFGLLTFVLVTSGFAAVQAGDVPPSSSAPLPPPLTLPFVQAASQQVQAGSALSTAVGAGAVDGLSSSAARMSAESARVRFWRPTDAGSARTVVVRQGQSLWDIAGAWGVSVDAIASANGLTNAALLKPGQRLMVPASPEGFPEARGAAGMRTAEARTSEAGAAGSSRKVARSAVPRQTVQTASRPAAARPRTVASRGSRTTATTVTLAQGQTLWSLARAHGVSVDALLQANGLRDPNRIRAGTRLIIPGKPASSPAGRTPASRAQEPRTAPLTVALREGQTLWSLARAHGVSVDAIVAANGLRSADRVRAGTRLVIPGRAAASSSPRTSARTRSQGGESTFTRASASAVRIARGFLWPARGQLTSRFGWRRWRHHDGIDIAAPYGSPIYAARPGRVVFAGWYYDYGRTVILDHGDGLQTLYGHASALVVQTGEKVSQGQLIARVGTTGRSTGPHLHFEVRVKGRPVNPMRYMN